MKQLKTFNNFRISKSWLNFTYRLFGFMVVQTRESERSITRPVAPPWRTTSSTPLASAPVRMSLANASSHATLTPLKLQMNATFPITKVTELEDPPEPSWLPNVCSPRIITLGIALLPASAALLVIKNFFGLN